MALYTTDSILDAIKTKGRVPTSQSTFTEARIRALIDDEISLRLLPEIMKVRENYYLTSQDLTLVANRNSYRIPSRAIGSKVKSVRLVDSNGNETSLLSRIEEEQLHAYQASSNHIPVFYFKNNSIILVPTPDQTLASAYTLRIRYFLRPSSVVTLASAAVISSINAGLNQVTVASIPSTISTGTLVDFVKAGAGFETMAFDQNPTVAGTTLTFSSLPQDLEVGDYIALSGQTPVPQIPADLYPLLSLRVAKTILQSLGFMNEAKAIENDLREAEKHCWAMISPRSESNSKKIVPLNNILQSRSGRSRYPF